MAGKDNTRFVRMALNLKMIDLGQFNKIMDLWEKDPTIDTGLLLRDQNFITQEQYEDILKMFAEKEDEMEADFDLKSDDFNFLKHEKKYEEKRKFSKVESNKDDVVYHENFTLKGLLGHGGIGAVFLCYDKNVRREVAIKEIADDIKEFDRKRALKRFVREARITGQLEHPGVVPVYELNEKEDGTIYYVMKHVKGKTLFNAINEASTDSSEVSFGKRMKLFDSLIDVCEAMSYAHSRNVIHRDLKPSNIILGEFGETIILDWGTAKKIGEEEDDLSGIPEVATDEKNPDLTRVGELLGTPSYMSPEQIDSRFGGVDARSDVFALGVLLFIILTGEKPYIGTPKEIMDHISSDNPSPSARSRREFVPPELDAICSKAMSKRKDDRFNDASEMLNELKNYRDGRLVSVYAYSRKEIFKRFVKRNKVAIVAVLAIIASIIIGAGFSVNFAIDAHEARIRAEEALINVTELSESALSLSAKSVKELDQSFDELVAGMKEIAPDVVKLNLSSPEKILGFLKELKGRVEGVEGWAIITPPGTIIAAYPPLGEKSVITPQDYESIVNSLQTKEGYLSEMLTFDDNLHAFLIYVPLSKWRKPIGLLTAIVMPDTAIPAALSFDPKKSDYRVWVMDEGGIIIYDEDPKQVGKDLFGDEMYAKFPELLNLGERMRKDPWGVGYYKFRETAGKKEIYKIAAWDTFTPVEETTWKIVVTYPYSTK